MLKTMAGLPPGVLGFEVQGELHADDYRQVLLPPSRRRSSKARRSASCWSPTSTG
jgi:hypothetical protein